MRVETSRYLIGGRGLHFIGHLIQRKSIFQKKLTMIVGRQGQLRLGSHGLAAEHRPQTRLPRRARLYRVALKESRNLSLINALRRLSC